MEKFLSERLLILYVAFLATACTGDPDIPQKVEADTSFVGSEQCSSCHEGSYEQWRGSHHQLAMQVANSDSVLGDFDDASLDHRGSTTRFYRRGDRYFVDTENASGQTEAYEVTYAFGVTPLQQYLVEFAAGRKQVLPFAWDSRAKSEGGQRWYVVYAEEDIDHDDPLHWTGRYYNWNYMCAECHSTNVTTGYDMASNSFDTTFTEISVGCESCHGPGSLHIDQAARSNFDAAHGLVIDLDDRGAATWVIDPLSGIAARSEPNLSMQQSESCGRCHARRGVIADKYEHGKHLSDTHAVALLEENLYHADGRILDEVYVYGSFLQSKMYAAGVTCTDCHNPHSGELHAGPDPNDTCAQCHLVSKFAAKEHAGNGPEQCVDCHMPATTYMGVDDRRDHSFRLPGTESDPDHYGYFIQLGRNGGANLELLSALANQRYPAMARATMLTLLERGTFAADVVRQFDDPDPLVRIAALRAIKYQFPERDRLKGSHLLRDPIRGVRIEAASLYVEYRDLLPIEDARAFNAAANEFRDSMRMNLSMPEAAVSLANFETQMGDNEAAAALLKHAVEVGPDFAPAQHAHGLSLVRAEAPDEALEYLRAAVQLSPDSARFVYVYGVALNSLGQSDEAVRVLGNAHERFKDDFDIGWALATIYRDLGKPKRAMVIAEDLQQRFPESGRVTSLLRSLRK